VKPSPGLKPKGTCNPLRGAEAPLFHVARGFICAATANFLLSAKLQLCGNHWYSMKYTITPVMETYIHSGQVQRAMVRCLS
jgi:hypothetical protein